MIKEKLNYDNIELHNLANVVFTDIHGAKGLRIGKKWLIQAIYLNPEQKVLFILRQKILKRGPFSFTRLPFRRPIGKVTLRRPICRTRQFR